MIRAIIIEDEINNRELLQQMLLDYCEGIEILGMAEDVISGIALLKKVKPDVVFLDVEMPGGTGFDVLNAFENPNFKVVFVTGYGHYAIKAIKYAALDYLLKPINLIELREAVEKLKVSETENERINFLKESLEYKPEEIGQIIISNNRSYNIIKFEDILYVEADRTYVTFFLEKGKKIVATNPLHYYENILPKNIFYRIHKSIIINCQKVSKIESGRGGNVYLNEGLELKIAVRRKPAFLSFLDRM